MTWWADKYEQYSGHESAYNDLKMGSYEYKTTVGARMPNTFEFWMIESCMAVEWVQSKWHTVV